jgi:23S rRNA (guanosine2251-2'-O)-methyltransferase
VTPVVEKVAAGGLEHVDVIRVGNLAQALRKLKEQGFWVYGAAGDAGAEDHDRADFPGRVALVLGEEHQGLRRLTRELCDRLVRIPSTGVIDSFNLGTASGSSWHGSIPSGDEALDIVAGVTIIPPRL